MKQRSASTGRNAGPILAELPPLLPGPRAGDPPLVLEIASGSGEHGLHFAQVMPWLRWQPSDRDPVALASISAWRGDAGLPNLLPPLALDVREPWPLVRADAVFCANMVHISPWACTLALLDGVARILVPGGPLVLYGPYLRAGVPTAPSNLAFDQDLRARDPAWGLRSLERVAEEARARGLRLAELVELPANNVLVTFRAVVP